MKPDTSAIRELLRRLAGAFNAPDRITPSQWAEQRRHLSPEASARRGGRFTFDDAPWQREVLDAIDDKDVGRIAMMWASQTTGKTETMNNIVLHKIDVDPCPMLVVQPTLDMGEAWSKDRLVPALRDTPSLRGKVKEARSRDSGNTILHKRFPGGHLTVAGANSAASLASRPIRLVLFDEVDRYPESAGTEGDPVKLAEQRAESFSDAMFIMTSTPTLKGQSRIEKEFELSDKRRWFCPCPKCGTYQTLRWEQVKWEKENEKVNWYECEQCHAKLTDDDRRQMVKAGEWRATGNFSGTRGYHINGIYCLFRPHRRFRDRIAQMISGYLDAKRKGKEALKTWTNTFLAETWEEDTQRVEMDDIMKRRENWGVKLPAPVCLLTCAVDVQADRLEGEVKGWAEGEESWGIERFVVFGNPLLPHVWADLDKIRARKWETQSGMQMGISILGIDSGGNIQGFPFSKSVYAYVLARKQATRAQSGVIAIKGANTVGAPLASESKQKNGVNLLIVGTDRGKSTLLERLKLPAPGPGYMHFPVTYGEEFFDQLSAEEMRTVGNRREWVKIRNANESLDINVYHIALIDLLAPNWKVLGLMFKVPSVIQSMTITSATQQTLAAPQSKPQVMKLPRRTPWGRRRI